MKIKLKRKFDLFKKRFLTIQTAKIFTNIIYLGLCVALIPIPIHFGIKMLILPFLFIIYLMTTGIIQEIEAEKDKLPIMSKRFTEKHDNGAVTIDKDRFKEAILYLYEIEDRIYGKK